MKKCTRYAGIALITAGTLTLVLTRLASLRGNNALLISGLLLTLLGIGLHIRAIKHDSRY